MVEAGLVPDRSIDAKAAGATGVKHLGMVGGFGARQLVAAVSLR
ncbi:MAG: hypothetical protein ACUVTH_10395 [Thermogutta sp.]